jgi:hypothetical protein
MSARTRRDPALFVSPTLINMPNILSMREGMLISLNLL